MQHIWAHARRDFVECEGAQDNPWKRGWLERIAEIYRTQHRRLDHYRPGQDQQSPDFHAAQQALEAQVAALFTDAEAELAGQAEDEPKAIPPRRLLEWREGLERFVADPEVPIDNNFAYSVNGISKIIPETGLFRNRPGNRPLARNRVQKSRIITNCILPLVLSPAYAKENTDVYKKVLSLGSSGLGSAACRPACPGG